jgi:two-component system KDP operon response regulator KdpE
MGEGRAEGVFLFPILNLQCSILVAALPRWETNPPHPSFSSPERERADAVSHASGLSLDSMAMHNDPLATKSIALVIDDEPQIRRLLRVTLEANGYRVFDAGTGQEGLVQAAQCRPDVILLDLGLPDLDGVSVLKRLREWSKVPVVVLSVRDRDEDKIAALDNGADDYVTKPFSTAELLARLRVAQRHAQPSPDLAVFRSGRLAVDLIARIVTLQGKEVKLTVTEYSLLRLFVQHAGKVLTHRQLLREVWGPTYVEQTHYLRVYVAHLREKLEANPAQPELIITEPGVGYRLLEKE